MIIKVVFKRNEQQNENQITFSLLEKWQTSDFETILCFELCGVLNKCSVRVLCHS